MNNRTKHERSSIVSLSDWLRPVAREVRMLTVGVYFVSLASMIPVVIAFGWGLGWSQPLPLLLAAWFLIAGSDKLEDARKYWAENVQVYERNETTSEEELLRKIVTEPRVDINMMTDDDRPITHVSLTISQIRDVCSVYRVGATLHRSDLNVEAWPNLSERWKNKEIQKLFYRLGLTSNRSEFLPPYGGGVETPERKQNSGTGPAVGGSS